MTTLMEIAEIVTRVMSYPPPLAGTDSAAPRARGESMPDKGPGSKGGGKKPKGGKAASKGVGTKKK
jgi:hypothetical protein